MNYHIHPVYMYFHYSHFPENIRFTKSVTHEIPSNHQKALSDKYPRPKADDGIIAYDDLRR